jgi:hypothetical protein
VGFVLVWVALAVLAADALGVGRRTAPVPAPVLEAAPVPVVEPT